jgi:hypothetical protein
MVRMASSGVRPGGRRSGRQAGQLQVIGVGEQIAGAVLVCPDRGDGCGGHDGSTRRLAASSRITCSGERRWPPRMRWNGSLPSIAQRQTVLGENLEDGRHLGRPQEGCDARRRPSRLVVHRDLTRCFWGAGGASPPPAPTSRMLVLASCAGLSFYGSLGL